MKALRFTIYEVLGYLAPGWVMLLALLMTGWSWFFPSAAITVTGVSLSKEAWLLLLLLCYTLGHLVQGLCNFHPNGESFFEKDKKRAAQIENAKRAITTRCKLDVSSYSCRQVAGLCQTLLLHCGKMDDHEVFLYREGYYRGSAGAFTLLTVAFVFRALRSGAGIRAKGETYTIVPAIWFCLSIICALLAIVFYVRFRRFAVYRVANLLNFACLPENLLPTKQHKAADGEPEEDSDA